MKLKRKATALILSLMMVLSMIPAMAFAGDEADTPEEYTADDPSVEVLLEEDEDVDEEEPETELIEDSDIETIDVELEEEDLDDSDEDLFEEELSEEAYDTDKDIFDVTTDIEIDEESSEEEEAITEAEDFGEADGSFELSIDPEEDIEGADPEEQVEEFLLGDVASSENNTKEVANNSVKGDRLSGNDRKYYKAFKSIIKKVSKAKTSKKTVTTTKKYSLKKFAGKKTFTAKQLGVKKIGYKKNGRWYVTSAAKKKIDKLYAPKDWKRVVGALISDFSNQSYWADWYGDSLYYYEYYYRYTSNKVTFYKGYVKFYLPVQPEFRGSKYKANIKKVKGAKTAKDNAKYLVKVYNDALKTEDFAGKSNKELDYLRLYNYCRWIAMLNTYDTYAAKANYNSLSYKGPWSWVYVLDGDDSTNAVCEGYAKALKYMCSISKFKSKWINCEIVSGKADGENHMWNIVRMNDGKNYVIDPTWMDNDYDQTLDMDWFLRGAPNGNADGYTIAGSVRKYHAKVKKAFAPAERRLSKKNYYYDNNDVLAKWPASKTVKLKKTKIEKAAGGRNSIKLKWKKITSHVGALYIDGYQIQYSTKKSMKGAKTIKVKGYNHTSKTIKKLKRGRKYYIRVRTYAKLGSKYKYSKWTKKKKVRVR